MADIPPSVDVPASTGADEGKSSSSTKKVFRCPFPECGYDHTYKWLVAKHWGTKHRKAIAFYEAVTGASREECLQPKQINNARSSSSTSSSSLMLPPPPSSTTQLNSVPQAPQAAALQTTGQQPPQVPPLYISPQQTYQQEFISHNISGKDCFYLINQ